MPPGRLCGYRRYENVQRTTIHTRKAAKPGEENTLSAFNNTYKGSVIQQFLSELTATGSFSEVADVIKTVPVDDVEAKLYLLGLNDAWNLPGGTNVRKCNIADGTEDNEWFLRGGGDHSGWE